MKRVLIAFVLSALGAPASASDAAISLQLNLAAHHKADGLNDETRGVGLQLDLARANKIVPFVAGGTLINSMNDRSWYIGGGHRYVMGNRDLNVAVGYFLGGSTYPTSRHSVIVMALPVIEIGTRHSAIVAAYIPKTDESASSAFLIQLRITP